MRPVRITTGPSRATSSSARAGVACLLSALAVCPLAGQTPPGDATRTTLEIDHQTGRAVLKRGADVVRRDIGNGATLELKPSDPFSVRVVNTNTAAFEYRIAADTVSVPSLQALRTAGAAFKPYLSELPRTFIEKSRPFVADPGVASLDSAVNVIVAGEARVSVCAIGPTADPVDRALGEINSLLATGPANLQAIRLAIVEAVQAIRGEYDATVTTWAGTIRRDYGGALTERGGVRRLSAIESLLRHYTELQRALDDYRSWLDAPRTGGCADQADVDKLLAAADNTLSEAPENTTAAYQLEGALIRLVDATTTWDSGGKPPHEVDLGKLRYTSGSLLKVSIVPSENPLLAPAADGRDDFQYQIRLLPDWPIRFFAGLSFAVMLDAAFPKFATEPAVGGEGATIVTSGFEDRRFEFMVNLGLVPAFLDWRRESGLYFAPLEFSANPSDGVRAVALGAALGWRALKFGAGIIWTKHTQLDGQSVGQVLMSEKALRTKEGYGDGRFYLSFSVVGFPPFTN